MNKFRKACQDGETETVKLLLEKGADPNKNQGLYVASAAGHFNEDKVLVFAILIKYNLVSEGWLELNRDKIPQKVWERVY